MYCVYRVFVTVTEKRSIDFVLSYLFFSNVVTISVWGIKIISAVFVSETSWVTYNVKQWLTWERWPRVFPEPLNSSVWSRPSPMVPGSSSLFLLFWILNFLVSSNLLYYVTAVSSTNGSAFGMCTGQGHMLSSQKTGGLFFLLWLLKYHLPESIFHGAVDIWLLSG